MPCDSGAGARWVERAPGVSAVECYYTVPATGLDVFLAPEVQSLLRSGTLLAVSHPARSDAGNVACVLPGGKLVLNLDKATFEELGAEGAKDPARKGRYRVEFELAAPSFRPGKRSFERARWCLSRRVGLELPFRLHWVPAGGVLGEESAVLGALPGATLHRVTATRHSLGPARVPLFAPLRHDDDPDSQYDGLAAAEVHEWLGGVACRVAVDTGTPDGYESTLVCPSPNEGSALMAWRWDGPLTTAWLQTILAEAAAALAGEGAPPWAALTVWGYPDAPVSWGNAGHHFSSAGENGYTFILFPDAGCGALYWRFSTHPA